MEGVSSGAHPGDLKQHDPAILSYRNKMASRN